MSYFFLRIVTRVLAFMKLCENRRNGEAMGTRNIIAMLDRRLFRTDHGGTIAIRSNLTTVLSKKPTRLQYFNLRYATAGPLKGGVSITCPPPVTESTRHVLSVLGLNHSMENVSAEALRSSLNEPPSGS
jgi:hypothetical protein